MSREHVELSKPAPISPRTEITGGNGLQKCEQLKSHQLPRYSIEAPTHSVCFSDPSFAGKRIPSFQELQKAHIAYLDAVIEEVDRLNAFTVTRHAKVGTQIKGYPTPKAPGCSWFPTGWDQWHNVSQSTRQGTPLARGQTAGLLGETEGLAVFRSER